MIVLQWKSYDFPFLKTTTSRQPRGRIVLSFMSEPPRSPSPSVASASGSVEVTGVLAVTATMDSEPKWTLSKVANDLHSHLSDSAQQLLDLDSPVDLRGLDIFKCKFYTIHSSRLSRSDSPS